MPPNRLRPSADDEGAHEPGDEPLWSESWYFDFADAGQGVGGWIRLGLIPNQRTAWINALLCGPDMPTVAVNDFEAALPDDPGTVRTDAIELDSRRRPSRCGRTGCRVRGAGEAYDDPAALLRGEAGRPVELAMDLVWTTAGTPYQYRLTPRYEIPCTVSGTVTVDGRDVTVRDVAGQRDHSWGVRDWWAWTGCGAHCISTTARISTAWTSGFPVLRRFGVGYLQTAGRAATSNCRP